MKYLNFFTMTLFFISTAWAKPITILNEITFQNGGETHRFFIQEKTLNHPELVFSTGKSSPKKRSLSLAEARRLESELNRIVWVSEFRKPAGVVSCTSHVTVRVGPSSSKVCAENPQAAGPAFGLLNRLRASFTVRK